MASSELVLITGATGFIGFKVLLDTLKLGYRTLLAVRSESKKDTVLSNLDFKALNASDRVSFVIVPDLAAPGAYDEAVKGVDYIIHVASPLAGHEKKTFEEQKKLYIEPAVQGTVGILESAKKYGPTVKRVIITSSAVAIKEFKGLIGQDEGKVAFADDRVPNDEGPYYNEFHAYSASKVAALNASDKWVADNKPTFDIVNIHPSFVEGRDNLITSAKGAFSGTNAVILSIAVGKVSDPLPGVSVHVDDVSRMHVGALDTSKIPAGSYIAHWNPEGSTDGTFWEDVAGFVQKNFPEQIKAGLLNPGPKQGSIRSHFDSTSSEKVFGFKFLDLEEQVKSVVGHYVELSVSA